MIYTSGKSNIGEKTGFVKVPYVIGENRILDHLNTAYYHIHGTSFTYPDHANNIVLTSSSGAWTQTGTIIQIIPAGALSSSAFDLHWINVSDISANGQLQIDIFKGASGSEIRIFPAKIHRNAVQSQEGSKKIQIQQQIAGERISCRLTDSTAGTITCGVSFDGHYYI